MPPTSPPHLRTSLAMASSPACPHSLPPPLTYLILMRTSWSAPESFLPSLPACISCSENSPRTTQLFQGWPEWEGLK